MLSERECGLCKAEGIPQANEGKWIVVCGNCELCGGILADETEGTPYVAKLERCATAARGYFLHMETPECPAALVSDSRIKLNEALKELEEE